MKTNVKTYTPVLETHEGGVAKRTSVANQLRRSVMSCLLFENEFYESGESIANRIRDLVKKNKPDFVAALAIEARSKMNLRHVPLLLVRELARNQEQRCVVADTLAQVIQRADELSEFLSLYWKDDKEQPIAAQVKKGLARAFTKFSEYDLGKYNRDADIKLRDVLFLVHARPIDEKQARIWKKLAEKKLKTPDTWETNLSAGKDKKETFTRLIKDEKLGALALLRNLRGMTEAGVSREVITGALDGMKTERVLPYRFIAAARYAPTFEPELESAMFKSTKNLEKLYGRTILLVDVSGSMDHQLSGKSDLTRIDAACGLAILLREICEEVRIFTFSRKTVEIPARRGFALRDAIKNSQPHNATHMADALDVVAYGEKTDRLIVISDEQTDGKIASPKTKGYMLNVASAQNGVGYGKWNHIDGFSESCVRYICEIEREDRD